MENEFIEVTIAGSTRSIVCKHEFKEGWGRIKVVNVNVKEYWSQDAALNVWNIEDFGGWEGAIYVYFLFSFGNIVFKPCKRISINSIFFKFFQKYFMRTSTRFVPDSGLT